MSYYFDVLALSLFPLFLTLTHLEFLGALWSLSKKGKEARRRRKQARRSRNEEVIIGFFTGIDFHV